MNERIKELAEQAKKHALDAMIKITDREQALKVYSESYDTKFAELIILECDKFVSTNFHDSGMTLGYKMKKHFGVQD
jgi:hypothetical protein